MNLEKVSSCPWSLAPCPRRTPQRLSVPTTRRRDLRGGGRDCLAMLHVTVSDTAYRHPTCL
eukprot:2679409-Rhodomonas_salina.1